MSRLQYIYAIQHAKTGRIYIGRSADVESRVKSHLNALRNGTHNSKLMQKDYDEYGEAYFVFELDAVEYSAAGKEEAQWMDKFHTDDPEIGYNGNDRHFTRKTSRPKNNEVVFLGRCMLPVPNKKEGGNDEDND